MKVLKLQVAFGKATTEKQFIIYDFYFIQDRKN